jgi:hypothetical protein
MHELFFLSSCLGFRAKKKKNLGGNGEDRFWSRTITPEEYACYYAMMLEESDMDLSVIKDDRLIISEIEKYANAGIELLLDDFLSEYCSSGLKLDPSISKELPKALLHFIYEQL